MYGINRRDSPRFSKGDMKQHARTSQEERCPLRSPIVPYLLVREARSQLGPSLLSGDPETGKQPEAEAHAGQIGNTPAAESREAQTFRLLPKTCWGMERPHADQGIPSADELKLGMAEFSVSAPNLRMPLPFPRPLSEENGQKARSGSFKAPPSPPSLPT